MLVLTNSYIKCTLLRLLFVGIIARYTSAEYTIILPGICGVLGGLIIIPILISKARKANEDERLSLKAIVISMNLKFSPVYMQENRKHYSISVLSSQSNFCSFLSLFGACTTQYFADNMNGVNKPQNVTEKITEPADEDELHIHYL